jgi:hypothetical protein
MDPHRKAAGRRPAPVRGKFKHAWEWLTAYACRTKEKCGASKCRFWMFETNAAAEALEEAVLVRDDATACTSSAASAVFHRCLLARKATLRQWN